ncbi:MAG: hypothetical protein KAH07_01650, partial [Flavobacteriaceae bacterium]|nr:hypothetical protein [Flavobacteriaceae bacterium]
MKKYNSLGKLLVDYRSFNDISQPKFAFNVNVDIRTVQRWERNISLIKPEKEEEVVLKTLLPYQLVHNLNATVPIPTYYDFRIRKYSLNEFSQELPNTTWFKTKIDIETKRERLIDYDYDIKYIVRFLDSQHNDDHFVNKELIKEAIRLLPELNFVITDDSGYYAGHCIIFPIKESTYLKLRNKTLKKNEIRKSDLVNSNEGERAIFFNYDITADCNDNVFYIIATFLRFFRDYKEAYLFCSYTERIDTLKLTNEFGLKMVWKDTERQKE